MNILLPDPSDEPHSWTEALDAIDILFEDRGDMPRGPQTENVPSDPPPEPPESKDPPIA